MADLSSAAVVRPAPLRLSSFWPRVVLSGGCWEASKLGRCRGWPWVGWSCWLQAGLCVQGLGPRAEMIRCHCVHS